MWGIVLVSLLVAGCDRVFGLDRPPPDAPWPIDARMPQPGCSGTRMLADDFEDGTFAPQLSPDQTIGTTGFTVSNGALRAAMAADGYAELTSPHFYDLRDDAVSVEAWIEGSLPPTGELILHLYDDLFNGVVMKRKGDTLEMLRRVAGAELSVADLPYDQVAFRFWKIAQAGEVTSWLTSSDGITFVERASFTGLPFPVAFMRVQLRVTRLSPQSFTGRFDNLNGGTPTGEACPAYALTDDFEDGVIDPRWLKSGTMVVETNGKLVATLDGAPTYNEGFLIARALLDLREGELVLELPQLPTQPMVETRFEITTQTSSVAFFILQTGQLKAIKIIGGNPIGMEPYDPTMHRWWRFRDAAGVQYWETSPDGINYRTLGQANGVAGLERAAIRFGVAGFPGMQIEGTFDNLNVAP